MTTVRRDSRAEPAHAEHRGALALAFQEAFTVAVRLRGPRQLATDAAAFRAQMKKLIAAADRDARRLGYTAETVKLAVYAFIAYLDETVHHSNQPMFADWPRQPLQEEVFGERVAGENFYRTLSDLLRRDDTEELADLLEVYQTCMLLGFRGRYARADAATFRSVVDGVAERIEQIRGGPGALSPSWRLPAGEQPPASPDPWWPWLIRATIAVFVLLLVLFVVYRLDIGRDVGEALNLASVQGALGRTPGV